MKLIDQEGEYTVTIHEPRWEPSGKDGEIKMALALPGVCVVGGEERTITAHLYFTPTLIRGGRNAGKPMYEVNADLCIQLGMSEPFQPAKRAELDGKQARFVVQAEEWEGKPRLKVAFVNPAGRPALPDADAEEIWQKLTGGQASAATAATEPDPFGSNAKDQVPF